MKTSPLVKVVCTALFATVCAARLSAEEVAELEEIKLNPLSEIKLGASLLLNQSHIMLISCNSTAVRRFYIGYRPSGRHPVLCMTRIDPFV